jgi:MFS family permease
MSETPSGVVRSLVPARMDRLPWARFHTRLVIALGVAWVLDGLEITIASLVGPVLQSEHTLHLSSVEVGTSASVYLVGEVAGALFFGYLSDRLGRRRLFIATLGLYLIANGLTAFAFTYAIFVFFRFFAGAGIGGEYAAINSAIDELIPANYRGHTDLAINGTYWLGALIGALGEYVLLNPRLLPIDLGWRIGLFVGPLIGLLIWRLRGALPESPRWLLMHGYAEEAERTVTEIERQVEASGHELAPVDDRKALEVRALRPLGYVTLGKVLLGAYPSRSALSLSLMISQSFLYNAIFFTYGLVLTHFYDVPGPAVPKFFFAFAAGNLLGPLTIGRLFDTIGRKPMIAGTYAASGLLLAVSGYLFAVGALNAVTQTVLWSVIFFIASAAASSAYLTCSEIFPLEIRAQAIAFFFAIAQICGAAGPWIFGHLIGDQQRPDPTRLFYGYLFAAVVMVYAAVLEALIGVKAERASLEDIAQPLSAVRSSPRATRRASGA